MTLLVLRYHRAHAGGDGNAPELLDSHFLHIARRYRNVVPGDALAHDTLNVCLSFDDAYFDFHAVVLPLLEKHDLRALLAVAPLLVREEVALAAPERVGLATARGFARPSQGAFCTWPELEEIAASGRVAFAAQGYTHRRLDQAENGTLDTEIDAPQTILGARLGQPVESFVFPFDASPAGVVRRVRERYRYLFRIGGASNRTWNARLLYRVDADAMPHPWAPFSRARRLRYRARYFWLRLCGR